VSLYYEGLTLKNAASNEWFRLEGDITTADVVASSTLYGLAFNIQPDGSYYAARINTGKADNTLQFVRYDDTGASSGIGSVTNSTLLETNAVYHLKIESFEPGVFEYTLTGPGLDGGGLAGIMTDSVLLLEDGYAGFYASSCNTSIRFDNLEMETGTGGFTVFGDDYDIDAVSTDFDSDASVSVGEGYELTQAVGDRQALVRILRDQIQLNLDTAGTENAGHIVLRYTPFGLTNSGSNESFSVEGDITTHTSSAPNAYQGLAFNYQADGRFYSARINNGRADNILQFIRVTGEGATASFGSNATNSVSLAVSSVYHLKIESSAPGVFNYRLTGPDIDNGGVTGTVVDTVWQLSDGEAGFYASQSLTSIRFDNLYLKSYSPVPVSEGFAAWADGWGVELGGETDDYDGDGLLNLAEYAFGGDPTDALDRGEAPAFAFDGSGMVYVYPQRSDDTTLGYTVKTTDDLVSGIWTNAGYSVIDTNVTGSTLDYVTNSVSTDVPQRFIKLEIQQN
jgi:hypothetical protein